MERLNSKEGLIFMKAERSGFFILLKGHPMESLHMWIGWESGGGGVRPQALEKNHDGGAPRHFLKDQS